MTTAAAVIIARTRTDRQASCEKLAIHAAMLNWRHMVSYTQPSIFFVLSCTRYIRSHNVPLRHGCSRQRVPAITIHTYLLCKILTS